MEGSTTVVDRNGVRESYNLGTDRDGAAYTPVNPTPYETPDSFEEYYIYGLKEKLRDTVLLNKYITVLGDGRIEVVHVDPYEPYVGTGTVINVYNRVGTEETTDDILVERFYIVIFGDVNGDSAANSLDSSLIYDETLAVTSWSSPRSEEYCAYKVMAADVNYDTKVKSLDASLVEDRALGVTTIDQIIGMANSVI